MTKDRIDSLRSLFPEYNIDGYIIPSNDKYMSEYVPQYAKRLEYITGFSGSNGMVIICKDSALLDSLYNEANKEKFEGDTERRTAAYTNVREDSSTGSTYKLPLEASYTKSLFFTDGRYLEQASKELDSQLFKIFDLKDISKFGKDIKIGYDPELFTYPAISNLKLNLQKIKGNLVDRIWQNQPLEPNSKVYLHDIKFAGISHIKKINKCRETFNVISSALVILDSSSICWLLNLRANDVAYTPLMFAKVIITPTKLYLFIDPSRIDAEIINARPEVTILPEEEFENILKTSNNIFIDDSIASVHIMDLIADKKVQKITDLCLMLKACKNDVEIKYAIDFHIKDAIALCEFLADLDDYLRHCEKTQSVDEAISGKYDKIATQSATARNDIGVLTEYSLGLKLTEQRAKQEGYVSDSFPAICGFQENSAVIHYRADLKTAKKIVGQGILLIDSGGQYRGATTDITRTIVISTPTDEQKKRYTQVLKGHIALAKAKFPKNTITGANLDILARQYLWQEMLDYSHGTGHGVGSFLSVHEGPQSINLRNKTILQPGMILSNEPGFYIPGKYGIRIENLMYVKENNEWLEFETLSLVPYASKLIDMKLLNSDEINYIKEYYNKIRVKIYSLLSTQAGNWLNNEINLFLQSLL